MSLKFLSTAPTIELLELLGIGAESSSSSTTLRLSRLRA